jgi:hypothetical protein
MYFCFFVLVPILILFILSTSCGDEDGQHTEYNKYRVEDLSVTRKEDGTLTRRLLALAFSLPGPLGPFLLYVLCTPARTVRIPNLRSAVT